ncbi:MAG TPA: hypothetical protein ENJ78_01365, partial [candidate division WWE3 bacterium]|nr:hypothetical protein [candidate division WWE3 bacterium]
MSNIFWLKDLPNTFTLKKGEKKDIFFFHTGNLDSFNLKINLFGEYASFNLYGAIFLKGNQKANLQTYTFHKSPSTFARINIK